MLQILESQRTVVAAVREEGKAGDVLPEDERLVVKSGIDVTNPSTLGKDLFEGVTQVVSAVGPTFSRTEEGPKYAPFGVVHHGVYHAMHAESLIFFQCMVELLTAGSRISSSAPQCCGMPSKG